MTDAGKANLKGAGMALVAFGIFASHDTIVKVLGGSYSTFQIVFFSVLLGFPIVALMLMRDHTVGTLIPVHPWWSALRTLAVVVTGSSAFFAFSELPLAQVYAILFATPLLITILSIPVLGERVGLHRWSAVALGLAGVLIVLRPGTTELTLGHAAALTAALGGATAAVVVRKIGKDERRPVLLLYPMMANFFLMGALLPFVYEPVPLGDLGLMAMIAVLGLVGTTCMIGAYKLGDAASVAPMQYSQILWAAGYGALFFGELPDAATWIGAAVIVVSGLYILLRESLSGNSRTTPVFNTKSRPETGVTPRVSALQMDEKDSDENRR